MKTIVHFLKINITLSLLLLTLGSSAAIHVISVQNYSFSPILVLGVHVGDTVRWVWVNGTHTTTSASIPSGAADWDQLITSGNTSYDYIPSVAGDYTYQCTPHISMGMVGSFTVVNPSSVSKTYKAPSVKILANPFYNNLSFQYSSEQSNLMYVKIYDLTGKLCREYNFQDNAQSGIITLNLQEMNDGIYLCEFIDDLNIHSARRIIKQ